MKVVNMKKEIAEWLAILSLGCGHKRAKRQLQEGHNFLDMIDKPPYKECETVSKLKQKISEERNRLKDKCDKLDANMPGHQFGFFETPQEVTSLQQEEIECAQKWLQEEIRWLHKCLGICSNRNYFN
jgi:hypothetical protein